MAAAASNRKKFANSNLNTLLGAPKETAKAQFGPAVRSTVVKPVAKPKGLVSLGSVGHAVQSRKGAAWSQLEEKAKEKEVKKDDIATPDWAILDVNDLDKPLLKDEDEEDNDDPAAQGETEEVGQHREIEHRLDDEKVDTLDSATMEAGAPEASEAAGQDEVPIPTSAKSRSARSWADQLEQSDEDEGLSPRAVVTTSAVRSVEGTEASFAPADRGLGVGFGPGSGPLFAKAPPAHLGSCVGGPIGAGSVGPPPPRRPPPPGGPPPAVEPPPRPVAAAPMPTPPAAVVQPSSSSSHPATSSRRVESPPARPLGPPPPMPAPSVSSVHEEHRPTNQEALPERTRPPAQLPPSHSREVDSQRGHASTAPSTTQQAPGSRWGGREAPGAPSFPPPPPPQQGTSPTTSNLAPATSSTRSSGSSGGAVGSGAVPSNNGFGDTSSPSASWGQSNNFSPSFAPRAQIALRPMSEDFENSGWKDKKLWAPQTDVPATSSAPRVPRTPPWEPVQKSSPPMKPLPAPAAQEPKRTPVSTQNTQPTPSIGSSSHPTPDRGAPFSAVSSSATPSSTSNVPRRPVREESAEPEFQGIGGGSEPSRPPTSAKRKTKPAADPLQVLDPETSEDEDSDDEDGKSAEYAVLDMTVPRTALVINVSHVLKRLNGCCSLNQLTKAIKSFKEKTGVSLEAFLRANPMTFKLEGRIVYLVDRNGEKWIPPPKAEGQTNADAQSHSKGRDNDRGKGGRTKGEVEAQRSAGPERDSTQHPQKTKGSGTTAPATKGRGKEGKGKSEVQGAKGAKGGKPSGGKNEGKATRTAAATRDSDSHNSWGGTWDGWTGGDDLWNNSWDSWNEPTSSWKDSGWNDTSSYGQKW